MPSVAIYYCKQRNDTQGLLFKIVFDQDIVYVNFVTDKISYLYIDVKEKYIVGIALHCNSVISYSYNVFVSTF